jgi:hypothetical protein
MFALALLSTWIQRLLLLAVLSISRYSHYNRFNSGKLHAGLLLFQPVSALQRDTNTSGACREIQLQETKGNYTFTLTGKLANDAPVYSTELAHNPGTLLFLFFNSKRGTWTIAFNVSTGAQGYYSSTALISDEWNVFTDSQWVSGGAHVATVCTAKREHIAEKYTANLRIRTDGVFPLYTFYDDKQAKATALCKATTAFVGCEQAVLREMQVADMSLYFAAVADLMKFLEEKGTDVTVALEGHSGNYLRKVQVSDL